jgi:histidinol-phosphate aminotransferase
VPVSRRNLLRRLGASIVAGAALPSLDRAALAEAPEIATNASKPSGPILLYHNENAYGPSKKALAQLRDASSLSNRYPRTEYDSLLAKIASHHAVKLEQIVLGCGSSEILRLAAAAFLAPGKKLVQASPTYQVLGKFAQSAGVEVVDVPINKMYEHDLDKMLERAGDLAGLVFICNPNNPTGTLTPRKAIEDFVRRLPASTMVLIDEAYHQFVSPNANYASFLDRPFDDPRVIVCRTFSKVYGLAGMRVGYAVAAPDVARRLSVGRLTFGVSVVAAKAAEAALDDQDYVRLAVRRNTDDRQEFMNQVNARMLRALDSHTNFVLMSPMRPVDMVLDHLKKHNVLVAPPIPAMDKYIRVSLGTAAEMEEFWRIWDFLPHTDNMAM